VNPEGISPPLGLKGNFVADKMPEQESVAILFGNLARNAHVVSTPTAGQVSNLPSSFRQETS
jgi:hypothetical protein